MTRTENHMDGMLRHLGAAYCDSLQGRASQSDVDRAVGTVAEHLNEKAPSTESGSAKVAQQVPHQSRTGQDAGVHGWSRRVGDVMATSVVTVDRATPYKEIARLLAVLAERDFRPGCAATMATGDLPHRWPTMRVPLAN